MRLIPMFGIPSTLDLDFFAARCRSTSRLEIRLELASGLAIGSTSRAQVLIGIFAGQPCGARRKSAGDGPVEAKGSFWSTTWNRFLGCRR